MKRAFYDSEPQVYEAVGNGSYIYRWDIKQEPATHNMGGEEQRDTKPNFSCCEVVVFAPVTPDKLTLAVVEEMWGYGVEQKMLNDFNGAQLGILDKKYIDIYKEFITQRKALKEQVDKDFATYKMNI